MVRHRGYFIHYATPATGLDSPEAFAEIFSIRRVGATFLERSGVGILELSLVDWRFRDKREGLGDENPWRCGDGRFGAGRNAPKRAREVRMARTPESSKRSGFSECVRRFDRHRLRALLCW
jgi:hypothetical protein